jgi:hypothetical protein
MSCASSCKTQNHSDPFRCKSCDRDVPCDGWYWGKKRNDRCIECSKSSAKANYERRRSPEELARKREYMREHRLVDPRNAWDIRLRATYNIDADCFDSMLYAQSGGCRICGTTDPGGRGEFHVDHDRSCCPDKGSCGICVRGLLCTRCNVGIAMFNDSIDLMREAIRYVQR